MAKKTRYVTTAIVYPNSRIHVGWAWECLGADWLVRAWKSQGHPTYFVTGMDEHSLNVQRAAESQGLTPQAYCDQMAQDIKQVLKQMGIGFDRFIRTSDPDHIRVVQKLTQKVFDQGDIYKAKYEGLYCESCEAFYTEKDLIQGFCPNHSKPPKRIEEENYFFKLSRYEKPLLEFLEKHPDFIMPAYRKGEILNFIQSGLKDFSISRSTFTWGVPLPFDPKHVVYVWFDALINYLTAAGFDESQEKFLSLWPADFHIIGKDITRFHCVFWPAMLMAMGLELPKKVFAHGFISLKGTRMSKSSGHRVTPDEVMAVTGADFFRYYLLAENQFSQDGNFDLDALILKVNADLANDWGNLVNRTISMTRKYFPDQEIVWNSEWLETPHVKAIFEAFCKFPDELNQTLNSIDSQAYINACLAKSRLLNLYIDQTKPWILAKSKDSSDQENLKKVMGTLLEGIRWIATAYLPVLPFGMPKVFEQLGIQEPELFCALSSLVWGQTKFMPQTPTPIYPRLESKKENP